MLVAYVCLSFCEGVLSCFWKLKRILKTNSVYIVYHATVKYESIVRRKFKVINTAYNLFINEKNIL